MNLAIGYPQVTLSRASIYFDLAVYHKQAWEIQALMTNLGFHDDREAFNISEGLRRTDHTGH
jgi:hypothetical protein